MKNFLFVFLTFILIGWLIFFYQKSINESLLIKEKFTTTVANNNFKVETGEINKAWNNFQYLSKISNLIQKNKQGLNLEEQDNTYLYRSDEFGFRIDLDKDVFVNDNTKNFVFKSEDLLALILSGEKNSYKFNVGLLINNDLSNCDYKDLDQIQINNNTFYCIEEAQINKDVAYNARCVIIKNNHCFDIGYLILGQENIIVDENIKIQNLLLPNINFY